MTNNYINFVAIEELFNQERKSIQDDKSLDYPTKRMLVNELDRVWSYMLQIPIRKIVSTDVKYGEIDLSNDGRISTWGKFDDSY